MPRDICRSVEHGHTFGPCTATTSLPGLLAECASRNRVCERSESDVYESLRSETSFGLGLERIRDTDLSRCPGRSYCHSMAGPGNATGATVVSAAIMAATGVQYASACLAQHPSTFVPAARSASGQALATSGSPASTTLDHVHRIKVVQRSAAGINTGIDRCRGNYPRPCAGWMSLILCEMGDRKSVV